VDHVNKSHCICEEPSVALRDEQVGYVLRCRVAFSMALNYIYPHTPHSARVKFSQHILDPRTKHRRHRQAACQPASRHLKRDGVYDPCCIA
jgi:hypothetical protein